MTQLLADNIPQIKQLLHVCPELVPEFPEHLRAGTGHAHRCVGDQQLRQPDPVHLWGSAGRLAVGRRAVGEVVCAIPGADHQEPSVQLSAAGREPVRRSRWPGRMRSPTARTGCARTTFRRPADRARWRSRRPPPTAAAACEPDLQRLRRRGRRPVCGRAVCAVGTSAAAGPRRPIAARGTGVDESSPGTARHDGAARRGIMMRWRRIRAAAVVMTAWWLPLRRCPAAAAGTVRTRFRCRAPRVVARAPSPSRRNCPT